jgi:hypothetical protein
MMQAVVGEHRIDVRVQSPARLALALWDVRDVNLLAEAPGEIDSRGDLGAHLLDGAFVLRPRKRRRKLARNVNPSWARRYETSSPVPVDDEQARQVHRSEFATRIRRHGSLYVSPYDALKPVRDRALAIHTSVRVRPG